MQTDFDMTVIGAGAAGLVAAGIAASLGARTALIEANRMGGDCTWTGCIPSKTLLKAAHVAEIARTAIKYGIVCDPPKIDFAAVMRRVDSVRRSIYRDADAPEVYERLGQLDALRSGADDDQARGQLLDLEDRLAGVVRNRVEALDFRKQRAASGRDQKIARG